ncbi:GNAT family N-acetyltransferase [Bifidobacterium callitrichidarum]|uniref:GNAT family N-acetyltransferase n=1 Tax=Bifidobacterium callitrichidarum TaxID=2052941 RepID=A0A2U2N6G7_9BIFI|nr:GNAT family N-acetyltransferase [Bifidobacterium callitrichidarum]PWG64698.1 GNAT family N-acetyltransferase [Bifidobacterium callitrichidarum]
MSDLTIRRATAADIPTIDDLLLQVAEVHHQGRPDLFKSGARKYTDDELAGILADDATPVFVAADADGRVLGYAFCIFQQHPGNHVLTDIKTLYIDDLCVDETARGMHVGSTLYRYVLDFARESGCYNVTLNVWSCNPSAQAFYERMGLTPYRIGMEQIL